MLFNSSGKQRLDNISKSFASAGMEGSHRQPSWASTVAQKSLTWGHEVCLPCWLKNKQKENHRGRFNCGLCAGCHLPSLYATESKSVILHSCLIRYTYSQKCSPAGLWAMAALLAQDHNSCFVEADRLPYCVYMQALCGCACSRPDTVAV